MNLATGRTSGVVEPGAWLAADDPPPFEAVNLDGASPWVLVCDHASNRVPRRLAGLGLDPAELERHIAWDIGAAAVARRLSGSLEAALFLSGYSRLVIDCNRPLAAPDAIAPVSDGTVVPANQGITRAEAEARAAALFWPYHRAIAAHLDRRDSVGRPTALLAIHSFTPVMKGFVRPWHIAVTWHRDRRLPALLLRELRRDPALLVGDNEPYAVRPEGDYAIPVHGEARGLPCALIEMRQDLVGTEKGQAEWAARLAAILEAVRGERVASAVSDSVSTFRPDCVVRDVRLGPGPDGYAIARNLRATSDVPVLFVSAWDELDDRLAGFDAGADDYMGKPFAVTELIARVRGLLRRAGGPSTTVWQVSDVIVDEAGHTVTRNGQPIELTPTEFALLVAFCRRPGRVLSKRQLLAEIWDAEWFHENVVEVRISDLRRKLEAHGPRLIHTVRGVGYVLRG